MTLRMDVDLWERLLHHAPMQRRSVGNLLQKLVADGLDRLDEEEALKEIARTQARLIANLQPGEARQVLKRQRALERRQAGEPIGHLPPMPPSLRGGKRKPDKT